MTGDSLGPRRKRARFRAWHRGTREMDLILGGFADAELAGFSVPMLDRFEALAEISDTDLLDWITGRSEPPKGVDAELIARIAAHHHKGAK